MAFIIGALFAVAAYFVADGVQQEWKSNEDLAASAPQETVVGTWAIKDSSIAGLKMLGVLGGVTIASLSLLTPSGRDQEAEENRRIASGSMKRCGFCQEPIRATAVACRYCGRDLPAVPPAATSTPPPDAFGGHY